MYYLVESKDNSIRIVDNITDIKTKESTVYKYCLEHNIAMKATKKDVRLSGLYCIPKDDNLYTVYSAQSDGYIFRGSITELYDLKFVHYQITEGDKEKINCCLKALSPNKTKLRRITIKEHKVSNC